MKTWLLTGASGYVGARLLKHPQALNASIIPCVRTSGTTVSAIPPVIADLSCSPLPTVVSPALDAVIHLAQSNNYRAFPQKARDIVAVNINSTAELVEQAVNGGARVFIFASTANVYGSKPGFEEGPLSPDSFYAASKLAAELLLQQYSNLIHIYILRIFTVYGPGQKGKLFQNIRDAVLKGNPISLAGEGLQITPIYIEDLIDIIVECVAGKIRPGTYNVCGDDEVNLEDVARLIGELSNSIPKFIKIPEKASRYCGSNKKLSEARKRKSFTPFRRGILSVNN